MKEASGAHFRQWYPSSFAEPSLLIPDVLWHDMQLQELLVAP